MTSDLFFCVSRFLVRLPRVALIEILAGVTWPSLFDNSTRGRWNAPCGPDRDPYRTTAIIASISGDIAFGLFWACYWTRKVAIWNSRGSNYVGLFFVISICHLHLSEIWFLSLILVRAKLSRKWKITRDKYSLAYATTCQTFFGNGPFCGWFSCNANCQSSNYCLDFINRPIHCYYNILWCCNRL